MSSGRAKARSVRRRPAEVRSLILDAATQQFVRNGYANTTKRGIAELAGVSMSVLDRHFESRAHLFTEAMLVPFAELLERTSRDWLRQRDTPLGDAQLMHVVINDMFHSLNAHHEALRGLAFARDELGEDIILRLRVAFDDLFRQLRLMAEVEAERRQWFSSIGLDLTLRIVMGMVIGTAAYDWILLPEAGVDNDQLVDEMAKIALWGLQRTPRH